MLCAQSLRDICVLSGRWMLARAEMARVKKVIYPTLIKLHAVLDSASFPSWPLALLPLHNSPQTSTGDTPLLPARRPWPRSLGTISAAVGSIHPRSSSTVPCALINHLEYCTETDFCKRLCLRVSASFVLVCPFCISSDKGSKHALTVFFWRGHWSAVQCL